MISPWDEDYQQTKRLRNSGAGLESPFKEMAGWVEANYGVKVLNVIYDTINPGNRPRLSVVLETEEEVGKFRNGPFGNFNQVEQRRVQEQLNNLLSKDGNSRFRTDGLFVIFVGFERVARVEANESVTDKQLRQLKDKLANTDLWEISRCFDGVTFFFYTDEQARKYESAGFQQTYAEEYSRLVKDYDEFGYLKKGGVRVAFDSKENFDNNYQSNWYYYYK